MAAQTLGAVAFDEPVTSTASKTLLTEFMLERQSDSVTRITLNAAEAGDGVRNEHTITIADPAGASVPDGAFYLVTITDGTTEKKYAHPFTTGETADQVAAAVAMLADLHPAAAAMEGTGTGVVDVKGRIAGVALTITVDCRDNANAQVAGAISTAETTAASGTVTPFRQYAVMELTLGAQDAKPKITFSGRWFNGSASSPTIAQQMGNYPTIAPRTVAQMQATA